MATRSLELSIKSFPNLVFSRDLSYNRSLIAEASLFVGLAISNTKTALCHSISYPLTAVYGVPHGLACAFTMIAVLELNLNADDGRLTIYTVTYPFLRTILA